MGRKNKNKSNDSTVIGENFYQRMELLFKQAINNEGSFMNLRSSNDINQIQQSTENVGKSSLHGGSTCYGSSESVHSTQVNLGDAAQKEKEEIADKLLELKNKEIDLLKRENSLLRRSEISVNAQYLFKDVEESMNSYNGDNDYALDKWIEDVNEVSRTTGWDDTRKTIYAKRLLSGTAKDSLRLAVGIDNWDKLKEHLRVEVERKDSSATVHRKMFERKKKPEESFKRYLIALREIAKRGCIEDESIFQYCIAGIDDHEMNKAILYGAKSMHEFQEKLGIYSVNFTVKYNQLKIVSRKK